MTNNAPLTQDDLLWLIGQKDATLLVVTKQTQALVAENEQLKTENTSLKHIIDTFKEPYGTDNRKTPDETASAATDSSCADLTPNA